MKILIACEESQTVCKEMRRLGHEVSGRWDIKMHEMEQLYEAGLMRWENEEL